MRKGDAMTTLLEEALESWGFAREGVIDELENLSDGDMRFQPREESRTVEELVAHVLESGALMSGELSRPEGSFRRKSYEELLREHSRGIRKRGTRRQLIAALRSSHREGDRRIRKAGEIHMLQRITRFDGKMGTRLAWMHHGIGHEEYHRGQIALYARLIGRTPALTKRIET
jgi:uncharacterized damage-inducible protein DinB